MIFNKDAIFPYPILSPYSSDYPDSKFKFDIDLVADENNYTFNFDIILTSNFLISLLRDKRARTLAIMSSIDNKVYELHDNSITIPRNETVMNKRTSIQLFIVANTRIHFRGNDDLSDFYGNSKKDIFLKKHTALAISNVIKFDGEMKKPFELFKYSYSPSIKSEIFISVNKATEFIEIKFRDESYSFNTFGKTKNYLMYPYVYIGLQKALIQMIIDLSDSDLSFNVDDLEEPDDLLYRKIYNYLKIKKVNEVSYEELDLVIEKISDSIVSKYTKTIGELRG
jgi:hypothetical protein